MKKWLTGHLVLGVVIVMLAFVPAMGSPPFFAGNDDGQSGSTYDTPDPSTLAMVATGIAGVGGYLLVRKRNHK